MRVRKPEADLKLSQASLIAAFDYQTRGTVKMQMESLAVAQIRIPSGSDKICASKVTTSGTLKLKQTSALVDGVQGGIRQLYNDNIFDQLEYQSTDNLLREYFTTRNETTKYDYTKWVQYSANKDSLSHFVDFEMVVRIPFS